MTTPEQRLAWTPREAAASTGLAYKTILRLMNAGEIKFFRVGHKKFVPDEELRNWIKKRTLKDSA